MLMEALGDDASRASGLTPWTTAGRGGKRVHRGPAAGPSRAEGVFTVDRGVQLWAGSRYGAESTSSTGPTSVRGKNRRHQIIEQTPAHR